MSHTLPRILSLPRVLALSLCLLIATSHADEAQRLARKVAGAWLIELGPPGSNGPFAGRHIAILSKEGTWWSIASLRLNPVFPTISFTDTQGKWKKSGRREITAKSVNFQNVADTQDPFRTIVLYWTFKFDPEFESFEGQMTGDQFSAEVDPLEPDAVPIEPGPLLPLVGKRLTIADVDGLDVNNNEDDDDSNDHDE